MCTRYPYLFTLIITPLKTYFKHYLGFFGIERLKRLQKVAKSHTKKLFLFFFEKVLTWVYTDVIFNSSLRYTPIQKENKTMTNAEIIMNQSIELMEQGIIKGTGRMFEAVITDAEGNEEKRMIEEPETIHTYQAWKQLGYQVKKGQKAKASFTIWKYVKGKKKDENEEEPEAKMFMTTAHFFTFDQVEKIA